MKQKKRKYIVTLPWRKGQQPGEVFESYELHPSLASHVKEAGAASGGQCEAEQLRAELKEAKAAQAKAEKELADLKAHRAENPELNLEVATPEKGAEPKGKK